MVSEIKRGYKQTEVGVIPEDWGIAFAYDVCLKIQDGTHFSPRLGGRDYLYLTSKNIRFGYMDISSAGTIDATEHASIYRRCDVKKGDILLTKDGANTGNAALNMLNEEFSLLSSVAFLRFNPNKYCELYFLQQILSKQIQNKIKEAMVGNAITRLTLNKIKKLKFPLPPTLAEQTAIATALSDTDALITSLEKLIAKKRAIKQGAMQELLRPKEGWEEKKLGRIAKVVMGQSPQSEYYNSDGTGLPLVQGNADIDNRKTIIRNYTSMITKHCNVGDTIMTVRAPVGEISKATFECCLGRGVCSISYVNDYIYHYLIFVENTWAKHSTGSTFDSVNSHQVMDLIIPIPNSLSEQVRIATILSDMDSEIESLEQRLSKTRLLKQGMMQELLTGQTRLI